MNKKFALLLIPLMLMPLMSFGYAHFRDSVEKRYKIHVGSVIANITYFHVDKFIMPDVNNNDIIMGDELNITIFEDPTTCKFIVQIIANPIAGGFVLNTTMKIHNSGKLPWDLDWKALWDGPYDDDPCWVVPAQDITTLPGVLDPAEGPWSFWMEVRKENASGSFPAGPTTEEYKPSNNASIKQHVNFRQPDSTLWPGSVTWQKDWECKWIIIWVFFDMTDAPSLYEGSSWTWVNGTVTSNGTTSPYP